MTHPTAATPAKAVNVLLIDNFDSFTFNLVDELKKLGATVEVWRNDIGAERALELLRALTPPRLLVLSPGPGRPEDAGCCETLIRQAGGELPIFGVCLGLQAITTALGGEVGSAGEIVHGKSAVVTHDGSDFFSDLPSPLTVGRYHSLVATALPEELEVSARFGQLVMALRHRTQPTAAVQFHPESILTPRGGLLLAGVLRWARAWHAAARAATDEIG